MSAENISQLEEKMIPQLQSNCFYEAQQYVQSFVARKKKVLGQSQTSSLVFHGARLLLDHNGAADAGTLLVWFIEDGAGIDFHFRLEKSSDLTGDKYCDADRLLSLLAPLSPEKIYPLVDKVYGPLHILAAKESASKDTALSARLSKLEEVFASAFESNKKWTLAFKAIYRVEDTSRMASILNAWSKEGYKTEQPLFFARAVFQLLSDKKIATAASLIEKSAPFIQDNATTAPEVEMGSSLATWHLATILSGLASLPPMPRVDKTKLFGLLMQLYYPLVARIDPKLVELLDKVGSATFNFASQVTQAEPPNPMTMLKHMLSGAPPKAPPGTMNPGFDLNAMMAMLQNMQGGPAAIKR